MSLPLRFLRTMTAVLTGPPARHQADATRAGNVAISIMLAVVALTFFAGVYAWFGDARAGLYCLAGLPGIAAAAAVLRFGPVNLVLARRLLTFSAYGVMLALIYQVGGVEAPCLIWLSVCPILGSATAGARSGIYWSVAVMLSMAAIYLADSAGLLPPPVLRDITLVTMIGNISFVLLVAVFLMVYEHNHAIALGKLGQAIDTIRQMAISDDLTGLYNRRELLRIAHQEKLRADRYGSPLSYCLIDIDHFKQVNDTWGHFTGDEVLRRVADSIDALVRATDAFGRYGGEEFILVLSGTGRQGAIEFAERIRVAVEALRFDAMAGAGVTISVGVAQDIAQQSVEQALAQADAALYEAKRAGRNQVVARPPLGAPSLAPV